MLTEGREGLSPSGEQAEEERLPENVVMIETESAKYRIMYGTHREGEFRREDIGQADALVLEGLLMADEVRPEIVEAGLNSVRFQETEGYAKLLEAAAERQKSVYLADMVDGGRSSCFKGL